MVSENWFADEDFWVESYPFMFPEESFSKARDDVGRIVELTGREKGALVDLSCGAGRHAVPFAERGFAVTGVDSTEFLLEKARAYATRRGAEVEWVLEDSRRFVRPEAFDLAISMTTSLGFFDDPAENRAVLTNLFSSLREGGTFVLDLLGREVLARKFEPTSSIELPDGGMVVQRRRLTDGSSRLEAEWLFVRDERVRAFELRLWIYSGREVRQLLERVGFPEVELYGGLDGRAYDANATRLIAVARKR